MKLQKKTYGICWLLLVACSSKDYLQKQTWGGGSRPKAFFQKKKKKTQLKNYKLQFKTK